MGDVLRALRAEIVARNGDVRVTRVAAAANLPLDRLREYLEELTRAGLVESAPTVRLTPRGDEFLRRYLEWRETLERFGLGPSSGEP